MSGSEAAGDLLQRWRSGDQSAAEALYLRYAGRLWTLAEREIGERLRRRVGPDDILQSVFGTFFRRTAEGQFSIQEPGSLWGLSAQITLNKVRHQAEFHGAGRRDMQLRSTLTMVSYRPNSLPAPPRGRTSTRCLENWSRSSADLTPRRRRLSG